MQLTQLLSRNANTKVKYLTASSKRCLERRKALLYKLESLFDLLLSDAFIHGNIGHVIKNIQFFSRQLLKQMTRKQPLGHSFTKRNEALSYEKEMSGTSSSWVRKQHRGKQKMLLLSLTSAF